MQIQEASFSNSVDPPHSGYPDEFDAHALVAQLGGEVARTLSAALERVATLATSGQIDRDGLRALREEIDLARRIGIMGQQLVRLGSPELQLAQERVDLSGMLREAFTLRQREFKSRGISVRPGEMAEVTMVSDAALMFSLIEALLDWAAEHARSRIIFRLEVRSKPTRARLTCAFLRRAPEGVSTLDAGSYHDPALSTMSWRLLKQTAHVLGLKLRRRDGFDRCEMRLSFPGADGTAVASLPGLETEDFSMHGPREPLLAGRHIVVLAAQRELRTSVREVLRPSGSMIDFVASLDEARRLFEDALPHAVIYEAALGGTPFERLRSDLRAEVPGLAFIQIAEEGRAFEVLEANGHPYASVGRDGLAESLPAALLFELSRHG